MDSSKYQKSTIYTVTLGSLGASYFFNVVEVDINRTGIFTRSEIPEVPIVDSSYVIAVNPNTNLVYVVGRFDNIVSVIDFYIGKVVANITVGNGPRSIDINTLTNTVYVANSDDCC